MIVRAVKIDKCVADVFQNRQRRRRTVDELTVRPGCGKCSLDNQIVAARFDAGFDQLRTKFLQFFPGKNRFGRAGVSAGSNERFIGAFAE